MIFTKKQEEKYVVKLVEDIYGPKLNHIERVMWSCKTREQLDITRNWAKKTLDRYFEFESKKAEDKIFSTALLYSVISDLDTVFKCEADMVDYVYDAVLKKL